MVLQWGTGMSFLPLRRKEWWEQHTETDQNLHSLPCCGEEAAELGLGRSERWEEHTPASSHHAWLPTRGKGHPAPTTQGPGGAGSQAGRRQALGPTPGRAQEPGSSTAPPSSITRHPMPNRVKCSGLKWPLTIPGSLFWD